MATQEEVYALLAKGYSRAEIAREMDVSRQYISKITKQLGPIFRRPIDQAAEIMPWPDINSEHKKSPEYRKLLNHLLCALFGSGKMTADKIKRLNRFYDELERFNTVVAYDPRVAPRPGSKGGGWVYVPRKKSDGELIIRVNEYTDMTPRDYTLWKMLPRER